MPEANKIYVKKLGTVHTVFIDSENRPVPIGSFDDVPAGAFPQTFNSRKEIENVFPQRELVFVERAPVTKSTVVRRTDASRKETENWLATHTKPDQTPTPTTVPQAPVAKPTSGSVPTDKANEFLKRLLTARVYASKKNQRVLDIQIAIVRELIDELFETGA